MTPLMYAIQTEWFDMAELMISAGASVDLQDSRGRTPLTLAVDCSEDVYVKRQCILPIYGRPMYIIGQTIIFSCCGLFFFMAALCNRGAIIFLPCDFYLSIFYLLLFFPRLISAAAGWMSTIL